MSFDYGGTSYPSYDLIKTKFLAEEKKHAACPEGNGHNQQFVEAFFFGSYLYHRPDLTVVRHFAELNDKAKNKGLLVVLEAIDVEMMARFNRPASEIVDQKDWSKGCARPASPSICHVLRYWLFADRWCAAPPAPTGCDAMARRIAEFTPREEAHWGGESNAVQFI